MNRLNNFLNFAKEEFYEQFPVIRGDGIKSVIKCP